MDNLQAHLALTEQELYDHMRVEHADLELPSFEINELWDVLFTAHVRVHAEQN